MSEGDFEVLPRGTMEELKFLREFVNDMISLREDNKLDDNIAVKVAAMELFYAEHVEKYPSP